MTSLSIILISNFCVVMADSYNKLDYNDVNHDVWKENVTKNSSMKNNAMTIILTNKKLW